ncbi:hypothetical protein VDIAB_220012 [Vibrio diabolicus]|nr:hypothetical protein VDIAB_220012 [Vibrio diabolicus]
MKTYLSILNSMSLTLYTLIKDEQNIRLKQDEKRKAPEWFRGLLNQH